MNRLRLQLMHREAIKRLSDAETLSAALSFGETSDSSYLLRLLGLELLLKLVYEVALKRRPSNSHFYDSIFADFPPQLQERLMSLVGERIGPSSFNTCHAEILREWGKNFIALRYPYERYENLTSEQYAKLGQSWLDKGAPLDGATFRFYPEELTGLLHALRTVADEFSPSWKA